MKIGIDIRTAGGEKAGKGWYTFNITRELLKIDKHNEYFLYADSGIAGFEEFKNAELKIINKKGLFWHTAVVKDLKATGINVFFAPSSFIIPALIPKSSTLSKPSTRSSIKTILAIHDLIAFLFPERHDKKAVILEKLLIKKAIKKSSKIVTISENTKEDLIEKFNIPENKIEIIRCAASEDFYPIPQTEENIKGLKEFKEKTNLPDKFFLDVGTIEPRKNYETLILSFAMIHQKYPDYHLIIVGKKGWQYEQLEALIRENYLQKFVHFLGYITNKNLNKLYNLAEAFVFPSYYEGFGIPPLEAIQCGCPIISSFASSMPEVIGEAGIYCDPTQPGEFAKAMETVITDKVMRENLINKGRVQCKKFSWKDSAQKLYNLIKNL